LKYDIISFWGALDNIVLAESARFGMPGDHENVVKLNADHSGVCKFGSTLEDQDNFKLVRGNIKDLYKNALKIGELSIINPVNSGEQNVEHIDNDKELYTRFAKLKEDRV